MTAPVPATPTPPVPTPPVRKARYEDFTLADLTSIRNLLRGGSVIDWHRLYFVDREEVDRFLRVNEIDPRDDDDLRRLAELRELAVEYLERHLGFQIPDEVAHGVPPRDLLLIASQKGKRRTFACIVLKAMHVMHHLAGRELLTKLPVSSDQIFHLVEEKVLRTVEELKGVGCPIVEFEWSRKHADSLITKLLAKKESIAADVYDKLRFRMITNTEEQLVFVMRELVQRLIPFNYVIPGQSVNDIIKIRETLDRSPALGRFLPDITDLAAVAADKRPTPQNEFSGPGYRMINFVADLPVRMDRFLCRSPDDPLFSENGTIVFVLTEFQIIDARTAENNQSGDNSHEKYKERQTMRVKARLMHGMKDVG
ncbi:MAG TPA: TIGR04552 family protein [Polyangia bacterium]|nr:TIGR04552 family protein [Polyangia bacterium]